MGWRHGELLQNNVAVITGAASGLGGATGHGRVDRMIHNAWQLGAIGGDMETMGKAWSRTIAALMARVFQGIGQQPV